MHRFVFVLVVAFCAPAIFLLGGLDNGAARAEGTSSVVITEIAAAMPSDHEWIEVANRSTVSVDLTDWKFYEDTTNHSLSLVQGSAVLAPGSYAIIADNASYFLVDYPGFTGTLFDSSWGSLNNSGELIGVKDNTGVLVEQFTYLAMNDASLERVNLLVDDYTSANWCERESGDSAGKANDGCGVNLVNSTITLPDVPEVIPESSSTPDATVTTEDPVVSFETTATPFSWSSGDVVLSEIFPQPSDGQEEWIELSITYVGSYDLNGLFLSDGTGAQFALSGTGTGPGFVLVNGFSFVLNNSGDTVTLSTDGTIFDTISYGVDSLSAPSKSQSVGRTSDDSWRVFPLPTPGAENVFADTTPLPVITLQSGEWTGVDSLTLNVSGASSSDPDGDGLQFLWDFGDGVTSDSENPATHSYGVGTYTLTLTVTDPWGASAVTSQVVTVTASSTTTSSASSSNAATPSVSSGGGITVVTSLPSSQVDASSPSVNFSDTHVLITEIFPNPSGKDAGYEWIEILNDTDTAVDLSGWSFKNASAKPRAVFLSQTLLQANAYSVITLSGSFLRNTGEIISLLSPDGVVRDTISYDTALDGESYALDDTGEFSWTTLLTPGDPNLFPSHDAEIVSEDDPSVSVISVTTGSSKKSKKKSRAAVYTDGDLSSSVFLNEIFPNPKGKDGDAEWIELLNTSAETVNLGNWVLDDGDDGSKPFIIPDTVSIAPFSTLLFSRKDTGLTLDNTGDTVRLFTFEHDLQDSVTYADVQEDASYARITVSRLPSDLHQRDAAAAADGPETFWRWTTDPTPGVSNPDYIVIRATVVFWDGTTLTVRAEDGSLRSIVVTLDANATPIFDALFAQGVLLDVTFWKDTDESLHFVEASSIDNTIPSTVSNVFPFWIVKTAFFILLGLIVFVFTLLVHRRKVLQGSQVPLSLSVGSADQAECTGLLPVSENQSPVTTTLPPDQ